MGILAPVTLKLRLLMQNLWETKLSWDDPVTDAIALQLSTHLNELEMLHEFFIPLCIKRIECNSSELHGFCDANEKAYGAVIWLRLRNESGECFVNLVAAKTFVAPKKKKSIPRLELMAALVLSRLINCVNKVLYVNDVFIWTDSAVVLHWLEQPAIKFKQFVSVRVQEIAENLSNLNVTYRYIKSCSNPADSSGITDHIF